MYTKDITSLLFWSMVTFLSCKLLNCDILRLDCKEYGLFNKTRNNSVFGGSVIAKFSSTTASDCERKCLLNNKCKSINVEKGDKACELVSKTALDVKGSKTALVSKSDWIFKTIDQDVTLVGENCEVLTPCRENEVCLDTCECTGYKCVRVFKDCNAASKDGFNQSGVYRISAAGFPKSGLPIYCDMETAEGPWVVFQRRVDNSVGFHRNWSEYKHGFGELDGNFWLGLDKLHLLAAPDKGAILRVDIKHRFATNKAHAMYTTFEIGNETDGYRLKAEGFSGDAGDSFDVKHNGRKFTTFDRDQDLSPHNCAEKFTGAWWFNKCHSSHLNGLYPLPQATWNPKYMSWYTAQGNYGNIMYSEMKLRYL